MGLAQCILSSPWTRSHGASRGTWRKTRAFRRASVCACFDERGEWPVPVLRACTQRSAGFRSCTAVAHAARIDRREVTPNRRASIDVCVPHLLTCECHICNLSCGIGIVWASRLC